MIVPLPKKTFIEQRWPVVGKVMRIRRFKKGVINKTYKISASNGAYVLRIYTSKNSKEVASEVALLEHCEGLPVPRIVKGKDTSISLLNSSPSVMYHFIKGEQARKIDREQRETVGAFLARFHKRGTHFRWGSGRAPLYSFTEAKRFLFEKAAKQRFSGALLDRFFSIARDVRRFTPSGRIPCGPMHTDVKQENVLFLGRKLTGVIDFDNAYVGPFLLDLAKSMAWFGIDGNRFSMKNARDVYNGYASSRKLTTLEYKELYRMMKFAFASHLYVDFFMKATGKIPDSYFNFLMADFYNSYSDFSHLSEQKFYVCLSQKND